MARRLAGIGNRSFVITNALVDLTATAGDIPALMVCPGDGAKLLSGSYTIHTAGVGSGAVHQLTVEHGEAGAGVALTGIVNVDADAAAAGTIVTFTALDPAGQPNTVEGTNIQLLNAESAAISTGVIVNVQLRWEL